MADCTFLINYFMFSSLVLVESKSSFFVSYICLKKNQFNIVGNLYKSFFFCYNFCVFNPTKRPILRLNWQVLSVRKPLFWQNFPCLNPYIAHTKQDENKQTLFFFFFVFLFLFFFAYVYADLSFKPGYHIVVSVVSVVSVVRKKIIGQIEFILSCTTSCICCIEHLYGRLQYSCICPMIFFRTTDATDTTDTTIWKPGFI